MSDDVNTRLREKTIQIAQLNQKLENLQVQLTGTIRRAAQLNEKVKALENEIAEKDILIKDLQTQLQRAKESLRAIGEERSQSGATRHMTGRVASAAEIEELRKKVERFESTIKRLKRDLARLSSAAMDVIAGKENAIAVLKQVVSESGDPKFRVLNMVIQKRKAKLDDLAAMLFLDKTEVKEIVQALAAEGEIEFVDEKSVIPGKKYREIVIPVEKWKRGTPDMIFEDLLDIVGRAESHENIAQTLEQAVDILEQKLSRGGTIVFEMRRTANSWKSSMGDLSELEYKIKTWKNRIESLS